MNRPHPTTIILLEDDATLRELLADGLGQAGYAVVQTTTGDEMKRALDAAASSRTILVADRAVGQDGPNGFQLASDAMQQHPDLRVIYISGTHIAIRRRVLGARERALLKPFAMSQLLILVRELGG